jgi:hypothetical protein
MDRIYIQSDWDSEEFTKLLNANNIPRIGERITTKDLEGQRFIYKVINIEHSLDLENKERTIHINVSRL